MLELAEREELPDLRLTALRSLGSNWFYQGRFREAFEAFNDAASPTREGVSRGKIDISGQIPEVITLAYSSLASWFLGDVSNARLHANEAQELAREKSHPYSIAFALAFQGILSYLERDPHAVLESCVDTVNLSRERGFPFWLAAGQIMVGWASGMQGDLEAGLSHARAGVEAWRRIGAELVLPTYLTMLGELELLAGDLGGADATLHRALNHAERTGETVTVPETLRHLAAVAQGCGELDQANRQLQLAYDLAVELGAPILRLRTAIALVKLRRETTKSDSWEEEMLRDARERLPRAEGIPEAVEAEALLARHE
jgi:predicted ATPase